MNNFYDCLDLVYWLPARKNAKNHEPTFLSLGITNYDYCGRKFWGFYEIDSKNINLDKYKKVSAIIVETNKGYHFYTKINSENPLKIFHEGYRLGFDKGQLKTMRKRYLLTHDKRFSYLILRVFGKYEKNDLKLRYADLDFIDKNKFFTQVLKLLLAFGVFLPNYI